MVDIELKNSVEGVSGCKQRKTRTKVNSTQAHISKRWTALLRG